MKFASFSLSAAVLFAAASHAQPAPQPGASAPRLSGQLFIAPSGEPFRSDWGSPYPVAAWFDGADTNHDGKLTQGEFVVDYSRYFDTLDLDHDGILSNAEIKRYENELVPEVQSDDRGAGFGRNRPSSTTPDPEITGDDGNPKQYGIGNYERERDRDRPMGGARFGVIAVPEPIISMDLDFDGRVSRREMLSGAQRRYQLLVEEQSMTPITFAGLPETWAQSHQGKLRSKNADHRKH